MGKKQSDINNRESKKERKKNSINNKSIYTSKHVRSKEALLIKQRQTMLPIKINEKM